MASLMNNTAHAIIIGGRLFIPRKPVDNVDIDAIVKKYPEVLSMMKSGQLVEQTKEEAVVAKKEFEAMEVDELKAYAKSKGIDIGRAREKDSILSKIRKAESEKYASKV